MSGRVRQIPKMVGQNVPSILFCPVCSECGAVIMQAVTYEECVEPMYAEVLPFMSKRHCIYPALCPKCGVEFEAVKMYKDLPYKGY